MAVRRTLHRVVGVVALTTVGLGTAPFVGTASAAITLTGVSPQVVAGKRPVVSAIFDRALDTATSQLTLRGAGPTAPLEEGTTSFSADKKTIFLTLDADLSSSTDPYTARVVGVPAVPTDLPPVDHSWTFNVDDTAPPFTTQPVVAPDPASGPVSVSGTTEPGAAVTLTIVKEGTTTPAVTRGATADAAGAYAFTGVAIDTIAEGTLRATVALADTHGNSATAFRTFVKDTVAPARAATTPADGKTSKTRRTVVVTFTEALRPADSTLVVKNGFNGTLAGSVAWSNANQTATFTSDSDLLPAGGNFSVATHAVDVAGNVTDTTTTFSIDNTAPEAPEVTLTNPVNAANVATAVVAGEAEPAATLTIEVDDATPGSPVTASAQADPTTGAYSVVVPLGALADGLVRATATATDYAGNVSAPGASLQSTKDVVLPAQPTADISSPIAANRVAIVSGTAALDVTSVSISVDDGDATTPAVTRTATPDNTGAYTATTTLTGLKDGSVTATVYAFDAVGNRSEQAGTDSGVLDTGQPVVHTLEMPTVNFANRTGVTASGTSEAGALVTITLSDGTTTQTASVTAAANGAFSRTFDTTTPELADGTLTLTAVAKDGAGNESAPLAIDVTKDVGVPAAPVLVAPQWANATTYTSVELSGTGEAGSTLTFTLTDVAGKSVTASHVTPPTGSWTKSVSFAGLAEGDVVVSVVQRDAAGNTSPADSATVRKDTLAPSPPGVTLTDPINPSNVGSAVVSGSAEAGSSVAVSVDDTDPVTPPVSGVGPATAGSYSISVGLEDLKDGQITATARATDPAGNLSAEGRTASPSTKDTTALAETATSPADGAVVTSPATVSATFNETISTTQTTIALRDQAGSSLAGTTSFTGGNTVVFTPVDTLSDVASPYVVSYSAKDADGSDSAVGTFTFTVDTIAPQMPTLSLPAVTGANAGSVVVSGEAEDGTTVALSVDDATAGSPVTTTVPVTGGAYSATLDLRGLADGTLTASAVATDVAGNASDPKVVSGTKDATPPQKPTVVLPGYVNDAGQAAVPVSGQTDTPGASVTITVDDSVPGSPVTKTTTADEAGTYATSVDVSGLLDGTLAFSAVATDPAGNVSETATTSAQKDVAIPAAPTVELADPVNRANVTAAAVSGVAEPGSTVLVSIDDTTVGAPVTATAPADATTGAYSTTVDVSALADTVITASVTARDAAGNVSAAQTDTAVKDATAPDAPTVTFFSPANLANPTVTVAGNAERGTTLAVSVDDTDELTPPVTGTGTEQPEGVSTSWSANIDVSSLSDGTLTATVVATDAAGNSSEATTATGLKDVVPPAVPTVSMPDPVNASMPQFLVSGTAEPGVFVWLSMTDPRPDSAQTGKGDSDEEGAYSVLYDVTDRPDGLLTVTAYAEDLAGNTSATTSTTATKDATAPGAPSVTLADPVNAANTTSVTVSGVAEEGTAVAVSVDDETAGDAVTAATTADGTTGAYSVSVDVTSLADGPITATVTATDWAGNVSAAGTDTATKDSTLPEVPTLAPPAPVTRASRAAAPFSGTAEPASTVTVTVDDADGQTAAVTGTTVTAPDGTWSASLDVSSLRDGVLSVAVTATDAVSNTSGSATGSAAKNSTRVFTVEVDTTPVSGEAQSVTVTAHTTYLPGSATDTTYAGTPVLSSADGHTTPGTCSVAVEGVSTCTGTVFGDLGAQALQVTEGAGEDLVQGAGSVSVQPVALVFGTAPPAQAEPNTPFTFTVLPTAGVAGASIDGYAATRTLVTNAASDPANGSVLSCPAAECSVTVKFLDRGIKTLQVRDSSSPMRSTPSATIAIRHHTVLTLSRSALTVPSGSSVTVSGKLIDSTTTDGVPNATIRLDRTSATGSVMKPLFATTGSDGTWSVTVTQTYNTYYMATFAATAQHTAAVSLKRLVKAARVVSATWSTRGRTVKVTGRVRPNAAGRTIYLQYRRSDGTWAYAGAKATVTSTGGYAMSRTFAAGRWTLRAAIAATPLNAAGYSATYRITLR